MDTGPGNVVSWAAGKKKVLCVGVAVFNCMSGVRRFSRSSNRVQRCTWGKYTRGGRAANTSVILKSLGMDVELLARLSTSTIFSIVVDDLRKRGISIDHCPRIDKNPQFAMIYYSKKPEACTVVNCKSEFPYLQVEDFQKLDLNQYGWIHFRNHEMNTTIEMMKLVEAHNATHVDKIIISMDFDLNLHTNWPMVDYCDYVFLCMQLALDNGWENQEIACSKIDQLLYMRTGNNLKRPLIISMWNGDSACLMNEQGEVYRSPAYKPPKLVDSLGLDESFIAGFIYAIYGRNRCWEEALDLGNRMVYYKCLKRGFDHLVDVLTEPVV